MTVFEFQADPDRNAIIRRALAKRIVRQRELDEEEASTEEDESFLENSPKIVSTGAAARKASASRSATASPSRKSQSHHHHHHHHHHRHKHHDHENSKGVVVVSPGSGLMNAKSRWKTEYLRQTSGSPSDAVSVVEDSEAVPENNLQANGKGDKHGAHSLIGVDAISVATATTTTETTAPVPTKQKSQEREPSVVAGVAALEAAGDTTPAGPDPVELEILEKLDGLRKEKSRLFALFREALQKKEVATAAAAAAAASAAAAAVSTLPLTLPSETTPPPTAPLSMSAEHPIPSGPASAQLPPRTMEHMNSKYPPSSVEEKRKDRVLSHISSNLDSRRPYQQDHDRISDQTPRQLGGRRRDYDRFIDRSKLNLEIPRKPMSNSASSASSTSSTPTSFAMPSIPTPSHKTKRQRSVSPPGGPSISEGSMHRGAGPFGGSSDGPTKYPRAEYMGPSGAPHGRHTSGGSNYQHHANGLPERPTNSRYSNGPSSMMSSSTSPTSLAPPTGPAASRNSGGRDSYYNDSSEGYSQRGGNSNGNINKPKGSGPNSMSNYSSSSGHGPSIPPTRIGFGSSNGINGNGPRSGGGGGRGGFFAPDGPSAGRGGGYHHGPPPPMSVMGGPGGPPVRGMPFNRNMMQMNHARGMMQPGRSGFGGGGGGGRGGGPPDRPMTSGRPDDWSRRRSRA
ncbi:hypothetical protein EMPS_01447 [Entomortierella parvispora]|uniref:Uncharacterized protein n=1 Tax=Entomortierella parvispora TaxID=205924 RepID=A0A9P3LSJ6_9FUNG|nr:hypothetical protein EMPS_01447 [Entomortierella parvispora]